MILGRNRIASFVFFGMSLLGISGAAYGQTEFSLDSVEAEANNSVLTFETYEMVGGTPTQLLHTERVELLPIGTSTDVSEDDSLSFGPQDGSPIDLDGIIRIGKEIWDIIEKGKPIYNDSFDSVSFIPKTCTDARDLTNWEFPKINEFLVIAKNGFKREVIRFAYRTVFSYNGRFNGRGKYLSGVTIEPKDVKVAWMYELNVQGQVLNPVNMGTKSDPLIGAELRLTFGIKTKLKESKASHRYYVRGDGLFLNQTDGTVPPLL